MNGMSPPLLFRPEWPQDLVTALVHGFRHRGGGGPFHPGLSTHFANTSTMAPSASAFLMLPVQMGTTCLFRRPTPFPCTKKESTARRRVPRMVTRTDACFARHLGVKIHRSITWALAPHATQMDESRFPCALLVHRDLFQYTWAMR